MTEGIISIVRSALGIFAAFILGLTALTNPTPTSTETAEITDECVYTLLDSFMIGQGYDNEGEYYYGSGSITAVKLTGLCKIDRVTGEIVKKNYFALPSELIAEDYDHIGDISVQDGVIYAPVEDVTESDPMILLYDTETLEYTGISYKLGADYLPDGVAWCATDSEYLYTSPFNDAGYIVVFDISDMSFVKLIPLSEPVRRVQAGDVADGVLYLNLDPHDGRKTVYAVDLETGETSLFFDRNVTGFAGTETEGICVQKDWDGSLIFNIVDYNKILSSIVRTYRPVG